MLVSITFIASIELSQNVADFAPLLIASIPIAPLPANKSNTFLSCISNCIILNKHTFGICNWFNILIEEIEEIELCGFCTDICVISNALNLQSNFHTEGVPITVDAKACAGVTPEKHNAALDVMESCQINVINR